MNVIYNSDNYYVVEYPTQHGYELVDKHAARGAFLHGAAAEKFLESMKTAIAEDASAEHVDDFLDNCDVLLNLPVVYH
ncbi:MAG: BTH_I0359 family protein [Burkholderiales bacterium]